MILHELRANSAKHGALSAAHGSLEVSWVVEKRSENRLALDWIERGGPRVAEPPQHGFGLTFIEREAVDTLGGRAKIEFAGHGLQATLSIPLDAG